MTEEYIKVGDGLLSQIDKVHEYPTESITKEKILDFMEEIEDSFLTEQNWPEDMKKQDKEKFMALIKDLITRKEVKNEESN